MLENLKKEYLVHEKQRIEKCEFLRSMLENEKDLEEDEIKEFMEDVEKMNKEREKRKIDLKAIEHIKMLMDELFTKKDTQSFLNFIQLHSKSLEATAVDNNPAALNGNNGTTNGTMSHNTAPTHPNQQNMYGGSYYNPQQHGAQCNPHQPPRPQENNMYMSCQQPNQMGAAPTPNNLTAAQLQQQHEAQVRKILRSGCPSSKNRANGGKPTICSCNGVHH